jgi:archaeosine synthase
LQITIINDMKFITTESLKRPEVTRWHARIMERYTPPAGIKLTVVLPCSARKPYSKSKSHRIFREFIKKGAGKKIGLVHEVMLTSPLGLVPRELEGVYPAAHYDTPVTGEWSEEEREIAIRLLGDYMKKAKTDIIAHVDGAYRDIADGLGIRMTPENIRSDASLGELAVEVSEALENSKKIKRNKIDAYRAVCDFQFGKGASSLLLPKGTGENRGRLFVDGAQVAAVNPGTGYLALSLEGGKLLKDFGKHIVEISFKPETNNIFSIGVENAGDDIRVGDEVIVLYKNKVAGVGRASLCGDEMARAKKGLAVAMRHREKEL